MLTVNRIVSPVKGFLVNKLQTRGSAIAAHPRYATTPTRGCVKKPLPTNGLINQTLLFFLTDDVQIKILRNGMIYLLGRSQNISIKAVYMKEKHILASSLGDNHKREVWIVS